MTATAPRARILGLDGVRALAALAVCAHHALPPAGKQFMLGPLGVRTFFVLSGYLIVGGLHAQRAAIEHGTTTVAHALGEFWARRVRRIFPLYFLSLLGFIAIGAIGAEMFAWSTVFAANVYFEHVLHKWGPEFTGHIWTLAVEEQFYALAAPAFLLITRTQHVRVLSYATLAGLVATSAYVIADSAPMPLYISSFSNLAYFTIGGLIALAPVPRVPVWSAALVVVPMFVRPQWGWTTLAPAPTPWLGAQWLATVFGCAALVSATVQHQQGTFVRALDRLRWIGTVSYGIYMWHPWMLRIDPPPDAPLLASVWPLVQLAATFLLAGLSWHLVERPLLRSSFARTRAERRTA